MSERNVKLFYNEMCKNEKLQNEIKEVLGVANTESDKQALLNDIAKKYNFILTSEKAKKFAENLSRNKISLDDLSDVSGGIGKRAAIVAFTALTALGSLGSAGAVVSHAGQIFSTPGKNNNNKADGNNNNNINISENSNSEDSGNDTTPSTSDNENDGNNNKMKIKKDEELKEEIENLDKKIQNGKNEINIKNVNNNENTIDNNDETKQKKRKEKEEEENKKKEEEEEKRLEEEKRKEKEEKLNKLNSEIINKDNINIFEGLVCKTENLKPLYRMTRDGANRDSMQEKIKGHSNIVVLVKTDENKVFGGYTGCEIKYNDKYKEDDKAFLFSIDLNEKFNIKENEYAINDHYYYGIEFGNHELVLFFYFNDKCFSFFGNEITRDKFCGGRKKFNANEFTPIEIEVFERTDVEVTPQERSDSSESSDSED